MPIGTDAVTCYDIDKDHDKYQHIVTYFDETIIKHIS